MAKWVVALVTIWVIGLAGVVADLAASAPKARAKTYGPRSYVISVAGKRMKPPRWVRRGDTRTKGPTPARIASDFDPGRFWVPSVGARASLLDLERAQ